ncbi:protein kinase domain-containing protein [Streptomyces flavofungini]|uniref:protein kinase domain-containing protein n=1 Tax=Streptomyces flavofungini TaxID=68200 RepID=UPI0019C1FF1B|nr:protein kinase [Streptomyces flavofungini]GHC69719.1 hypothetical protein GCM10010349_44760 [Streptomyces flavofungini]
MSARDDAPYVVEVARDYRVGRWTVREPLGTGAFGSVYAARRPGPADDGSGLPRTAALKFLPTGTRTPRQLAHLRELAERELELLRRLRDRPRLIRLYETLTVDDPALPALDGATVLVLERAETSLDRLTGSGPAPPAGPAILAQVCEGLGQLHAAGWVHGDLKPANVLLMRDGSARLADFSTAAELDGTHAYAPAFATVDYTPPELLWGEVGERGARIRPTADIWAFGVLAHHTLTGTFPWPGGTPSARRDAVVRYARGTDELRLSPRLPAAWRDIVTDCLSRTHAERARYDASLLLRRVTAVAAGAPPERRGLSRRAVRGRPRFRRRGRARLVAGATAALLALGVGIAWTTLADDGPGPDAARKRPTSSPTLVGDSRDVSRIPGADGRSGYDRCPLGAVCFFTGRDGAGDLCAWVGDDSHWQGGEAWCGWADDEAARSVFNHGRDTSMGEKYVDVIFYGRAHLKDRLDCVEVGARKNFPVPLRPRSHTWSPRC